MLKYYRRLVGTALNNSLVRFGATKHTIVYAVTGLLIGLVFYSQHSSFGELSSKVGELTAFTLVGFGGAWGVAMICCIIAAPFQMHVEDANASRAAEAALIAKINYAAVQLDEARKTLDQRAKRATQLACVSEVLNAAADLYSRHLYERNGPTWDKWKPEYDEWFTTSTERLRTELSPAVVNLFLAKTKDYRMEEEANKRYKHGEHLECLADLRAYMDNLGQLRAELGPIENAAY